MKKSAAIAEIPEWPDPIERLATAILGIECGDHQALRAVKKLNEAMVDWNEVRASYPVELHRVIGNQVPSAELRCASLIRALNAIYNREHVVSLERLRSIGRREARHYFDDLDGVDSYAAASVILWSLGGHAIPVGDRALTALRGADLVHPTAGRADVQAFLERHVAADKAKETALVLEAFGAATKSARSARKKVAAKKQTKKKTKKRRRAKS